MPRTQEHVPAGGFIGRPRHRLFMVLDDLPGAGAALEWLRQQGVATDDVWLLHGEEGSRALDPYGRREGLHGRIVEAVRWAMSDDVAYLLALQEAVDAGASVVAVPVADASAAEALGRALQAQGAREMAYFGNWVFQPLRVPTS